MIRGILHQYKLEPHNLAMVGDRLYTDIAMAHRAGALGVLVLTGESDAEDAAQYSPAPDLVVADLAELGAQLRSARSCLDGAPHPEAAKHSPNRTIPA
jgi:NagD protein